MTVPLSLLLDLLVSVLLVVTIGYAVALNRRLKRLKDHKAEIDGLAASFAQATARAEESVGRLKSSVAELQAASERAQSLRDDLAFLAERGGTTADRLENLVRAARDKGEAAPATKPKAAAPKDVVPELKVPREDAPAARPDADKKKASGDPADELLKALRLAR